MFKDILKRTTSAPVENQVTEKRFFEGTNVKCKKGEEETIGETIQKWSPYRDPTQFKAALFEEVLKKVGFQMPVTLSLSSGKIMINGVTEIQLRQPEMKVASYNKNHILIIDATQRRDYSVTFDKDQVSVTEEAFLKKIAKGELQFFYPTSENINLTRFANYSIRRDNIFLEISLGCEDDDSINHYPELDEELLDNGKSEKEIYKALLKFYPEINKNLVRIVTRVEEEGSFRTLKEVQILDGEVLEI